MVCAEGLCRGNEPTEKLSQVVDTERPVGVQLWGNNPERMAQAARLVCDKQSPEIIDINAGCPAKKIIRTGAGCALLKSPELLCKIVQSVSEAVDGRAQVWVKTRLLPEADDMIRLARLLENAGVKVLTLHARVAFTGQGYSSQLREDIVKEVVENVEIPIVWNGGIRSLDDAEGIVLRTGCTGFMIGRAALGNPFVFKDRDGGKSRVWSERVAVFKEYAELAKDKVPFSRLKAHAVFFARCVSGAASIRQMIFRAKTRDELLEVFVGKKD